MFQGKHGYTEESQVDRMWLALKMAERKKQLGKGSLPSSLHKGTQLSYLLSFCKVGLGWFKTHALY